MFKILEHYNLNDLYRVISEYDHQTCVQLSPRPQQQDQQQEQRTTLQSFMGSSVTPIKAIYPVEDPYNADAMRRIAPLAISPTMNFTPSARNSVNFEYFTPRQTQKLLSSTTVRSRGNYPMSGRASLDYTVNFSLEEGEDLSSPSPQVCSMSGTPLKLASPRPGCPEYGASDEEGAFTEAIYDFTLSVVGRDAQGNLYLSVNKDDGWTFLDLFTMNTFEVEQLFCWNETIVITNVSFSASLKLIGISIKRASMPEDAKWIQKNGSSKDTCVYQSFVVCADDPGRTMHPVGDPSLHPQRVQFLFDENTSRKASLSAAPTPTKPVVCSYTSYFLVTTLAQSLIVYNVQARVKKYLVASSMCEETTVHRAPRKETLIAGDHIWSKYELKNKLLYFVSRSTKGSKSKEAPPACVLVRVPMGEARFRASGEWQLSQCFAVPHGVATNLAWDTESPFPYTPRRQLGSSSIVAPLPSVSVVSLGGPGTACLCIQHEFDLHDAEDVLVPISVVHLATQTRIDYSIPVPKRATKAKQFGKLRVLFDAVSDYLLVYIPGVYLHLLDLSLIHNPTAGMAFVGADATPLVPQVLSTDGPDDFYSIAPFPLSQFGGDDRAQNSFLDLCTGTVYDYGYDRKFVVGLVGNNSNGSSTKVDPAKVLHMALMHMQDEEVVEKIIGKVLSTMPELATQSLFKEYILGETFCSLTRTLHPHILSGVPPTAVEQNTFISEGLSNIKFLRDVSVVPMTSPRGGYGFKSIPSYRLRKYWRHIGNTPRGKRLKITKKESLDILSAFSGNSSNNNSNSSNGGSTASSEFVLQRNTAYMKPFYELVKQRSKRENIDDSQIKTPSGELLDKVILGLSRRILELNPKLEGGYAQACAEKYHYAQCKSVDILFSDILEQMPEIAISEDVSKSSRKGPGARAVGVQRRRAFCVMENFLGALVEMGGVLLPQGFSRKFLHLGYSCLPKAIFIQYVERGVLTVTKGFVWSLYERGAYRKDFDFFYLLLCKLSVGNIVDILISKAPLPLFFVEHFLSRCPKVLFSDGLELDESSPFYPLSLVLQSLHKSVEALKAQESEILFRYADLPQKYREEEHVVADLEAIDKVVDTFYFYETLDLS